MRELQIIRLEPAAPPCGVEADLGDRELLAFALNFSGKVDVAARVDLLLAEFGDVEIIMASPPEELRRRGRLGNREVGIIKLLNAFRTHNRRGRLLN